MVQFSASRASGQPLSLVLLTLDDPEHTGDRLSVDLEMRQAIELVRPLLDEADVLARRNDELLVLLPGAEPPEAKHRATAIREAIRLHRFEPGHRAMSVSLSVTALERWHVGPAQLLYEAYRRLLHSRRLGPDGEVSDVGNECVILPHPPSDSAASSQHDLEACLLVIVGPERGHKYVFDRRGLTIGRSATNDICVDHGSVSPVHAMIAIDERGVRILDLSTSGTHVNDRRVEEAVLESEDVIQIGHSHFKLFAGPNLERGYHEELYRLATVDPLTGVFNWRYFTDTLERELSRARRYERPLSVAMLDIDAFWRVNEAFDVRAGDRVLRALAELVRDRSRKIDTVARREGNTFGLCLPDLEPFEAARFVEKLRTTIEQHEFEIDGHVISLTISAGVATLGPDGDADDLLALATRRVRKTKRRGRNHIGARRA